MEPNKSNPEQFLILLGEFLTLASSKDENVNSSMTMTSSNGIANDYNWLLIIDLVIFLILTFTTYSSSKKLSETTGSSDNFRQQFIKGLALANGVRALSLVVIFFLGNICDNTPRSWFVSICHIVPAFVFVSAYLYLVTFLADLYYSRYDYENHIVKHALLCIVVIAYIILALMALITYVFNAYKSFAYLSEFLMGLLYLILGTLTIYYGRKVSMILHQEKLSTYEKENDISVKLKILSQSIGGLFLLKALCGILPAMKAIDSGWIGVNIWDFFWFLILEITPTVIFIYVARRKEAGGQEKPTRPKEVEMDDAYQYNLPFLK